MDDDRRVLDRSGAEQELVSRVLGLAREHLGLEVSFIGRFRDGRREVVAASDAAGGDAGLTGASEAMERTYCGLIAAGTVEEVVADTRAHPVLRALPVTEELDIGAYAGVPIVLADGSVYGTLCAYAHSPRSGFASDGAAGMRVLAAVVADRVDESRRARAAAHDAAAEVDEVLSSGRLVAHGQPVVDLRTGEVVGVEALARVVGDHRGPLWWLRRAEDGGRLAALEAAAVRAAGVLQRRAPAGRWLFVNLSAPALLDDEVRDAVDALDHDHLVVEVTEHALAEPAALAATLAELRASRIRIALDDVGAAHATLERIVRLQPELIKVDRTLVSGCDADPARRALLRAVRGLAVELGAGLVAEGIETPAELSALRDLDVPLGQGFLLGRPDPTPATTYPPGRRLGGIEPLVAAGPPPRHAARG